MKSNTKYVLILVVVAVYMTILYVTHAHWFWFYLPFHAVVGILSWGWFNYSLKVKYPDNDPLPKVLCIFAVVVGVIGGPISFLSTLIFSDNLTLRGLRFL